jgi:hypothetical protein
LIRRILHAELSDVRALASEARRSAVNAIHHRIYIDAGRDGGCIMIGPGRSGTVGAGFVLDNENSEAWPDGARLLTIGRVTLAAWGGRQS